MADVLKKLPSGRQVQQGWSPQCAAHAAPPGAWGVLKTTAVQHGAFAAEHNKALPETLAGRSELEVREGDLLLTAAGPRARCGVACLVRTTPPRLMISGKIYRFRADPGCDARFLEYWLQAPSSQKALDERKTGISDSGLNLTQQRFLTLPVPLPGLPEQRRIVAILEDHLSRLDAADAYLAAGLRRAERFRGAVLERALSSTDAPLTPVAEVLAAPLANGRSVPDQEDGFPVLRLTSLRDGWIDRLQHKRGRWSTEEARPHLVRDGDFLVARGNGSLALVGRGGLVTKGGPEVAFPDTLIRIRPAVHRVLPEYLRLAWHTRSVRAQIEPQARTTAGIYKVNQQVISGVRLPTPSLADQQVIVDEIASADEEGQRLTATMSENRRRVEALRRALLTAAFTGRLTGRSSDMDIAQELADSTT